MKRSKSSSAQQPSNGNVSDRERLELLRFDSDEAQKQAIGVLIERGMLNLTSYKKEEWLVRTSVARKLRELGVPFDWVTENA